MQILRPQPQVFTVVVSVFRGTLSNKPLNCISKSYFASRNGAVSGRTPPVETIVSFDSKSDWRYKTSPGRRIILQHSFNTIRSNISVIAVSFDQNKKPRLRSASRVFQSQKCFLVNLPACPGLRLLSNSGSVTDAEWRFSGRTYRRYRPH